MTGVPARLEWTRQPGTGPPPAILGDLTGKTVIELGCGSGHNLAVLAARHGAIATGIDHDPAKVTRARQQYGNISGLQVIHADAANYLFALPAASVDACLSIFGAFSFSLPGPLLMSAARALRPGGLLAITLRASDHHDTVVILARRSTMRRTLTPCLTKPTSSAAAMTDRLHGDQGQARALR
jgi:SAM-dependent methyltransferase